VHTPNIGALGQRQRLRLGLLSLGVAILLGIAFFVLGASRGWRLTLFVPLWLGALGIFQALDKT